MVRIVGPTFQELFPGCSEKGPEFEQYINGNIAALHRYEASQRARAMDAKPVRDKNLLIDDSRAHRRSTDEEDADIELIRQFLKAYRERSASKDNVIESGLRTAGEVASVGSEIGEAGASLLSPQNDDDDRDDDDDESTIASVAIPAMALGLDKPKRRSKDGESIAERADKDTWREAGAARDLWNAGAGHRRNQATDAHLNAIYKKCCDESLPIVATAPRANTSDKPVSVRDLPIKTTTPAGRVRAVDGHELTFHEQLERQCMLSGVYMPGGRR